MQSLIIGTGTLAALLAVCVAVKPPTVRRADDVPTRAAATVVLLTPAEIARASATIDQLVDAGLQQAGQQPNAATSDETFLRRAYLSLIGRIPSTDEALAFLGSTAADKRSVLIDRLLASEGRVAHDYIYWADLLRVADQLGGQRYPGQPWIDWLKQSIRENKPYDRFVREMLTADGPALATGNGATGFYLRDGGMPLDHAATTAATFLSTQIGCAQCHDHPFDVWKQRQFYEFAAYTANSDARRDPPGNKAEMRKALQKDLDQSQELRQLFQRLNQTLWVRVNGTTKAQVALPADYQYDDAKPKSMVSAKVIFGADAPVDAKQDPRIAFAAWMTAPENPRFTLAIANRLWKRAFGVGLIEPVDSITDETKPTNPELMDFLVRLMVSVRYDLRAFQAAIYKSQAWQRQAASVEPKPGEPYLFPGPTMRRLTAEQAWDSLLTLVIADPDTRTGGDSSAMVAFFEKHKDLTTEQYVALVKEIAAARAEQKAIREQFQALRQAMNKAKGEELKQLRERQQQLTQRRDQLAEKSEMLELRKAAPRNGKGGNGQLLRAAELPQPAPAGHFLRVFGQSDREVIDNGSTSPAVTQALFLLNGPVDAELAKADSQLNRTLAKATDDLSRIRGAYLSILSRQPTAQELVIASAYLRTTPDGGMHDLCWALINSSEFLFLP